ncbi:MAG: hypothetical protein CMH55_07435 [Myxococcales bacterium]|nr:hypothetical protein [Myxococcales bacterium]|tara:strand:- start:250 stop:2010 length:1761 start_codon:yes stop_codon:yes gene_type:complete
MILHCLLLLATPASAEEQAPPTPDAPAVNEASTVAEESADFDSDIPEEDSGDDDEISFDDEGGDDFGSEVASTPVSATISPTQVKISASTLLSLDLAHEPPTLGPAEQYGELYSILRLEIIHKLNARQTYRVKVKNRVLLSREHPSIEGAELHGKILPELDQLRLDAALHPNLTALVGLQRVNWGFVDAQSPANIFGPPDLRFGFGGEAEDSSLPVSGVVLRFQPEGWRQKLELAWNPLFRPPELMIFGSDWAMQAPNRPPGGPLGDLSWAVDPSVAPRWQTNLTYFQLPELKVRDHSLALRASGRHKGLEWGFFGFYGFDLFPVLELDEDLAWLLENMSLFGSAPMGRLLAQNPELIPRMEAITAKISDAQSQGSLGDLIKATPHRLFQLGGQLREVYGPFVIALESTWTPGFNPCRAETVSDCRDHFGGGRSLFDLQMAPVRRPTLYSALQLEWQRSEANQIILVITDFMVADVPNTPLAFLDSTFIDASEQLSRPFDVNNAHLITVTGAWRSRHLDDRLEVLASVVSHPVQGDYLAFAKAIWRINDGQLQLSLGGDVFGGDAGSMFGQFNHNDRISFGIKALQ